MLVSERVVERPNDLKSEYIVYSTCMSDLVEVSFQLPVHDWTKLENSEVWRSLDEYLSEVQKPYEKMYRQDQQFVVERVVYKNPLTEVVRAVHGKMIRLLNALCSRNTKRR